jgi:hypothetical protein
VKYLLAATVADDCKLYRTSYTVCRGEDGIKPGRSHSARSIDGLDGPMALFEPNRVQGSMKGPSK